MTTSNLEGTITKEEVEVYDRQIRLWGLEAQNKLRASSALLVGMSGLGAEVAKNLMLCGLKALTLADDKCVTEEDCVANFLLEQESLGKNRATSSAAKTQSLNPMVVFKVVEKGITAFEENELREFSLIILIDQPYPVVKEYDEFCRKYGIKLMAGCVYGWTGYAFFDFDNHPFLMKQPKVAAVHGLDGATDGGVVAATIEEDVFEKMKLGYPSFEEAMNVQWQSKKLLRKTKRLVPSSYISLRAILRIEEKGRSLGEAGPDEFAELIAAERKNVNHDENSCSLGEDEISLFYGPQLSPVCAIVGGIMGQEAIKVLSEGECPLRNFFIYSAVETTGHVVFFPPQ